jgi:ribonuclease HI
MPWVIAELRGKRVYARADASGKLVGEGGRVEIRYDKRDGRLYRAGARNLTIVEPTVLPDDTCAEAEEVKREAPGKAPGKAPGNSKAKSKSSSTVSAPNHDEALANGEVVAYTDGACSGNPGPAGLGVVVLHKETRIERYEYLGQATNNVAELMAVIRALEEIEGDAPARIYTDSSYTIGVAQKGWKAKANTELVAELKHALAAHGKARLIYVKGHAGIELNERADELARQAIRERGSGRANVAP